MIYISIDNDYHASLAIALIKQCNLEPAHVTFISHSSLRNRIIPSSKGFKKIELQGHPLSGGCSYAHPLTYARSISHQRNLNSIFQFKHDDVLIITTEYQLNNAILAKKIKREGGRVFVFDEGIGFHFNNSLFNQQKAKLQDKLYLYLYNLAFGVLGIPAQARKGYEGRMFACVDDRQIDRIYSGIKLPVNRSAPVYGYRNLLCPASGSISNLKQGTAFLFASNFAGFNLQTEEMQLAVLAIEKMTGKFSEVYVKVHPQDCVAKNEVFAAYASLQGANVKLVDDSLTAVQAIELYRPEIVVGSMSTSLFDAMILGCQAVFLFHLLPSIEGFDVIKFNLNKLHYNFISSLDEIVPGYKSGIEMADLLHDSELPIHFQNEIGSTSRQAGVES